MATDQQPSRHSVDLRIPVEEATGLSGAEVAVTTWLPEVRSEPPVVCFGLPGGGYARRYFSFDLPGTSDGEAGYHVDRGWIFVTVDHLGVGESTVPEAALSLETIAAAGHAAAIEVVRRLGDGSLSDVVPPVVGPTLVAVGQSMGGHFLLVQQAHHRTFDGIAILGSSAIQTVVPARPGTPPIAFPFIARSTAASDAPVMLNAGHLAGVTLGGDDQAAENPLRWAFHFDDEAPEVVARDMDGSVPLPPWRSATIPACAGLGVVPGVVASEAATITVPVFVGNGERDVVPNPWLEPFAYRSSSDVTVYVCGGMAHMHNFARTRLQLWQRLHHWGAGVAAAGQLS